MVEIIIIDDIQFCCIEMAYEFHRKNSIMHRDFGFYFTNGMESVNSPIEYSATLEIEYCPWCGKKIPELKD